MGSPTMPTARCPQCGKRFRYKTITDTPSFPFCCDRCKMIDLGAWLEDKYRISEPLSDDEPPPSKDEN